MGSFVALVRQKSNRDKAVDGASWNCLEGSRRREWRSSVHCESSAAVPCEEGDMGSFSCRAQEIR